MRRIPDATGLAKGRLPSRPPDSSPPSGFNTSLLVRAKGFELIERAEPWEAKLWRETSVKWKPCHSFDKATRVESGDARAIV